MSSVGNPILAVADAVPKRIEEAKEERDKLIARVLELNQEIATLETLRQVAPSKLVGEASSNGPEPPAPPKRKHPAVVPEPASEPAP